MELNNLPPYQSFRGTGLTPLPERVTVDQWQSGGKTISVVKEREELFFSTIDQEQATSEPFLNNALVPFGMRRTLQLIQLFHQIIQVNLEEYVSNQSIIPLLYTDGFIERESNGEYSYDPYPVHVALFGTLNSQDNGQGLCEKVPIAARWGIYHLKTSAVTQLPIDRNSKLTAGCLNLIPCFSNRAKYDNFVRKLRPVLTLNGNGEITSVALRCVSLYDPTITLSEQKWAVTVILADYYCPDNKNKDARYNANVGHAMIAFEGIKEGQPSLEYGHIAQNTRNRPPAPRGKALPEISMDPPKGLKEKGPTWIRSKEIVERMIASIKQANQEFQYIDFSMARHASDSAKYVAGNSSFVAAPFAGVASLFSWFKESSLQRSIAAWRGLYQTPTPGTSLPHGARVIHIEAEVYARNVARLNERIIAATARAHDASMYFYTLGGVFIAFGTVVYLYGRMSRQEISNDPDSPHNCASWVHHRLAEGGIIIEIPTLSMTPSQMVASMWDQRNVTLLQ